MAILISDKVRVKILSRQVDPRGRYIFANVDIDREILSLATIYEPNEPQIAFLKNALQFLSSFAQGPSIIGGDLNLIADHKLDYSGSKKQTPGRMLHNTPSALMKLLIDFGLSDIWRSQHRGERDYTSPPQTISVALVDRLHVDNVLSAVLFY